MKIVLGSASKWRKEILQQAGYDFTVMAADIDERSIRHQDPATLAMQLAHAKADALIPRLSEPVLLITVDQIVVCDNVIFEKPRSAEEVRKFCTAYGKHPAQTITAVVVTNTKTGQRAEGVDIARVEFHSIPTAEVDRLIEKGEVFHCAGGFQIEAEDGKINACIKRVEGSVDSVKGLPMVLLRDLMRQVL